MNDILKSFAAGKSLWEILLAAALILTLLFSLLSISAEQGFLAIALISWIVLLVQKKRSFAFPAFFWPLLAYAALSLVATAVSRSPGTSFKDDKDMLIYILVPIVYTAWTRRKDLDLASGALWLSGLIAALYSIAYFIFEFKGALNTTHRVRGFMGHYMTQGGILLIFLSFALAMIFFRRGRLRLAWAAVGGLGAFALLLTLMRSGWIGLGIALCVILALWKPKTLILVPALAALVYLAAPRSVKDRIASIFTLQGYSNMERVEYAGAGLKIIKDYPLFGTGPNTVSIVFQDPKYGLSELAKRNVHLHNNLLMIAAERGIVTMLAWLAFIAMAALSLLKLLKTQDKAQFALTAGALSALAAFFTAGFMEFNFGDSEVITLLLFIMTLPFAWARLHNPKNEG